MEIPCPKCNPCLATNQPYDNISTEAVDQDYAIGQSWGHTDFPPPLSSHWYAWWCYGECDSTISQADADACAFKHSLECDSTPPPNPKAEVFCNDLKSASAVCPNGLTYSYDVPAGVYCAPSKAKANEIAQSVAKKQVNINKHCGPSKPACVNIPLSPTYDTYTAKGVIGPADFTFSVHSGSLPPGVVLVKTGKNTAILAGTPTQPGNYSWTVWASLGFYVIGFADKMCVMGMTSSTPPPATVGVDYSFQLTASCNAHFTVDPVMIPIWLTVSSTGLITGTPDQSDAGIDFQFDVNLVDNKGTTCAQQITIPVIGSPGPSFYWKMDEPASPWVDSVEGFLLPTTSGVISSDPGKIVNCVHLPGAGGPYTQLGNNSGLPDAFADFAYNGKGITVLEWFKVPFIDTSTFGPDLVNGPQFWTALGGSGLQYGGFQAAWANFGTGGPAFTVWFQDNGGTLFLACQQPTFPWADGQWHFLAFVYDGVSGTLKYRVDNGAWVNNSTAQLWGIYNPVASFVIPNQPAGKMSWDGGFNANSEISIDEVAVWMGYALTDAQVDYMYNGGAGRTWPITLP